MSKHIPQFRGVLGHTFMEFLKGSGDYCQAQHAAYADEWTAELTISQKHSSHRRIHTLAGPGHLLKPAKPGPGWGNLLYTALVGLCLARIKVEAVFKREGFDFYCPPFFGQFPISPFARIAFFGFVRVRTIFLFCGEARSTLFWHSLHSVFTVFFVELLTMARMNRPAPVEITYKNMRFLITHNPTNATLNKFIEELKKYGVTTIVRVCETTYDATLVGKEGIQVLDWPFDDGAPPSNQIVDDWLNLLKVKFREEPGCCIAVHCVAGLGRAPVLVALALIECGLKYEDAVQFIRLKRRGAFNSKQLIYLEKYRSKMRLRFKDSNGHRNNCCIQ